MPETTPPEQARISSEVGRWERHLCEPVTGRRVIGGFEVLAGMSRLVTRLQRWGAQRPLLVADGVGAGPVPLSTDADVVMLAPLAATSLTEQVRGRLRPADRLTPDAVAAIERYDPDRSAWWWLAPISPNDDLLGRPVLGGRPAHQLALEDKLLVDALLDAIGAARAPAEVTVASLRPLLDASARVGAAAGGSEVVWAGDARDGINGGSDYIRWIRTSDHAREAAAFFADHCDRVRVSPFLEGVPCSIHGLVLPDGVVVLRPLELASLRNRATGRFLYAGMGTGWDPASADAAAMRQLARDTGEQLRRTVGYRGAFGLDGVLTRDGFRVTELNTRFSGGLTRLAHTAPSAQLELVQVNALIGRDIGATAAEVETIALTELTGRRFVEVLGISNQVTATETSQYRVRSSGSTLEVADDDADAIGTVSCGPSPVGAFVRLTLDDGVASRGDTSAVLAARMFDLSDRLWQTGFGVVELPVDVRSPGRQPTERPLG